MADPDEVEELRLQLQLQEIKLEALSWRLSTVHRLLVAWRERELNDYDVLVWVGKIVSGCATKEEVPW